MIRRVLILAVVAVGASCQQPAKSCESDSQCPAGSRCVESVCVQSSGAAGGAVGGGGTVVAGGTAGSMGGGASGGGVAGGDAGAAGGDAGAGGGSAGGISGGGAGGGSPTGGGSAGGVVCNCQPWQTCADTGRCDDGRLTVLAPTNGLELATGSNLALKVAMLQFDGGTWTTRIPYSVSATIGGLLIPDMDATVTPPPGPQRLALTFGWRTATDGGLFETRAVNMTDCSAVSQFEPWQECVPTVDGGEVRSAGYTVSWASPMQNAAFNGNTVSAEVRIARAGGPVSLVSVPVSNVDGGRFDGTGGVFAGVLPMAAPEGLKTFVAGWPDGGPSATLTIERDTISPTVSLAAMSRPSATIADPFATGSWVKDEVAYVSLTVQGAVRPPAVSDVVGMGFNANADAGTGNCGTCVAPDCICVAVDLANAPLAGLRGDAGFSVPAGTFIDRAGNQSAEATTQMGVTRLKWLRLLARPTGSLFVAAPVLDTQGNLYVGASNNTDNLGSVVSLHPLDGGIRWQNSSLGAVQALAAASSTTQTAGSQDLAYVAANEDASGTKVGRLRAVRADNGGVSGLSASICLDAARPIFSAPALVVVGAGSAGNSPQIGALGIFNSVTSPTAVSGEGCIYRPANGAQSSMQKPEFALPEVPTPASSVVNLVSTGSTHYSVNSDFSIESWSWGTTALLANGGLGRTSGPTQTGLVALGGGGGAYPLLTTQISSTPLSVIGAGLMNPASIGASGYTRASPAVVFPGTGSSVFVLTGGDDSGGGAWLRLSQLNLSAPSAPTFMGPPQAVSSLPAGIESLPTSPIYGDANQVYVVTRGGRLFVLNATTSGLTFAWSGQLTSQGDVLAHPTLDCNRSRSGAPGVLYSISSQGTVSAVVVDSRRLGSSVWPKWQRTAGNAGSVGVTSTDFPLNPGCP